MTGERPFRLPPNLRKLTIEERRQSLSLTPGLEQEELQSTDSPLLGLSDVMIESAVGFMPVPLGVATGFLIDGINVDIPMATEEPSVVAAATYAGRLIRGAGGFQTWSSEPVMTAEILVQNAAPDAGQTVMGAREEIARALDGTLVGIVARGGGFRDLETAHLPETGLLRILLHIDVRDVMGANVLNTASEAVRPLVEKLCGGQVLMAIITNRTPRRLAGARFSLDASVLATPLATGEDVVNRIVLAGRLAQEDPYRAVTHNKGIMNGITALALATANDTRGIEAAAHSHASRDGQYRGLSTYRREADRLVGEIELPLPIATVGGGVSVHPAARGALKLLGNPAAVRLAQIAAALGLAQNLAAVRALVTEGIQTGHMRHHATRLAYQVGARGREVRSVAELLVAAGVYNLEHARTQLAAVRDQIR